MIVMRYFIFLALAFSISLDSFSQNLTLYYDRNGEEVDSEVSFYSITYSNDAGMLSYYSKSKAIRFKEKNMDKEHTKRSFFYESGQLKAEGVFYQGYPYKLVKVFYENGKPQSELFFVEFDFMSQKDQQMKIRSYWDESGNVIVEKGNGICNCSLSPFSDSDVIEKGSVVKELKNGEWTGSSENDHTTFIELYEKGNLKKGVQSSGGENYEYSRIESLPMTEGGNEILAKHFGSVMRYPAAARRNGTEGKVFVQFRIQNDGSLTEINLVKGIGSGCDEEALKVIKTSPKWNPGMKRGRPVKYRYTLPIMFKLG
jgi:TonB family protein